MAEKRLNKKDRLQIVWRSTLLQASWNYERMQNGGWAYLMIPAIKRLYSTKEEQSNALKRHLEFFNTQPFMASPIIGVTMALEEERANGALIDDAAIQGVKVGMMGPLAGVGDPLFYFTLKPILAALGATLALTGSIAGPLIFFLGWNIVRVAFMWYTQEFGYKAGTKIVDDLSGNLMGLVTKGASILGMLVLGSLVQRWVTMDFVSIVSEINLSEGAYINWGNLPSGVDGIRQALIEYNQGLSLTSKSITTLQENLDQLIPGLMPLLLTFFCMWLLKKKVSPIVIILGIFLFGIVGHVVGIL